MRLETVGLPARGGSQRAVFRPALPRKVPGWPVGPRAPRRGSLVGLGNRDAPERPPGALRGLLVRYETRKMPVIPDAYHLRPRVHNEAGQEVLPRVDRPAVRLRRRTRDFFVAKPRTDAVVTGETFRAHTTC